MTTKTLTATTVEGIFLACLFKEGEDTANHVKAEGIVTRVGFHPQRLEEHKAEIAELLDLLPDTFKRTGGGGMLFLNACFDRNDVQWTGMHSAVEQLFLLGLATGKVTELMPRELWSAMPGGMPYYVID